MKLVREVIIIFGKTGSGKSYFAKNLLKKYNRVIIIDSQFEYNDGIIFENYLDLANYYLENLPDDFKFICRFSNDNDIEYLFKFVYDAKNLLLVCEEAEIYISPDARQGNFLRLVRYGRHSQISLLLVARRSSELSLHVRAQVTRLISFKQTDINDIKKMESLGLFGLENLPEYHFKEITP